MNNSYTFSDFVTECIHPEAFSGRIPILPRMSNATEQEEENVQFLYGAGLIYDSIHDVVDVFDEHKYDFYEKRYVMLGAVIDYSKKEIKCLSPYFIKVSFNPQTFKKNDDFVSKLKATLKEYTQPILERLGKDVSAEILKEQDIKSINEYLPEIAETLRNLSTYILFKENVDKILIEETSVLKDGSFLLNSFGPEYYASQDHDYEAQLAAQSEYKTFSTEEFFNSATNIIEATEEDIQEEMHPVNEEEHKPCNVIYTFKEFKKEFKKAEWFECYIPIVLKIKVG